MRSRRVPTGGQRARFRIICRGVELVRDMRALQYKYAQTHMCIVSVISGD